MNKTLKIAVVRHGQKDGDALTPLGERQIAAATKSLLNTIVFSRIAHSPFARTTKCAEIALEVRGETVVIDKDVDGLSFKQPFAEAYNSEMALYEKDLAIIKANGNTVAAGLKVGTYAQLARQNLSGYLLSLAETLQQNNQQSALCFSHSPYHTLAVPENQAGQIPYQGEEASCVIYTIADGQIANAQYIPCPPVE